MTLPKSWSCFQLRIHSVRDKYNSLQTHVFSHSVDILTLNETWVKPSVTLPSIRTGRPSSLLSLFNLFRMDFVVDLLSSYVTSETCSLYSANVTSKSFQICISIPESGNQLFVFVNFYRPPFLLIADMFREFQSVLEFLISSPLNLLWRAISVYCLHMKTLNDASQKCLNFLSAFDIVSEEVL